MLKKFKWLGISAAVLVVLGLAACEHSINITFIPSVNILSPDAGTSITTGTFYLEGTFSDGGKAVDGVYVKVGSSGTYALVPGTANLENAYNKVWSNLINISSLPNNSVFSVYVKAVSGSIESVEFTYFSKGSSFNEAEPNDSYSTADTLTIDAVPYKAQIQPSTDEDWFKITLTEGVMYTIKTIGMLSEIDVDTKIFLYNIDHYTQLAYNDDFGSSQFSQVAFSCPGDGTYFIKVVGNNSMHEGTYAIQVTK
jgi:hypothetical protein